MEPAGASQAFPERGGRTKEVGNKFEDMEGAGGILSSDLEMGIVALNGMGM